MLRRAGVTRGRSPRGAPCAGSSLASVVMVYASYWFVMEPAQAHAFYVLAPVALVLAAYCWTFVDSPGWRRVAVVTLATNIVFHAGLAIAQAPDRSLYKHRDIIIDAIQSRRPDVLGHRRPFAIDARPIRDWRRYAARSATGHHGRARDIYIGVTARRPLDRDDCQPESTGSVSRHPVLTTYRTAAGRTVERHEFIKDIFKTCESRVVELNDGYVGVPFEDATFRVVFAEALRPSDTRLCESRREPIARTSAGAEKRSGRRRRR